MKKLLGVMALFIVGMVSITACGSTESSAVAAAPTPDQTGTAESVKAAADASFLSTEEANTVLETAAAATETAAEATETQLALLATDMPTPSPTPTLEPTPPSSPTPPSTPSPTPTPEPLPFPFSNPPPIQWEGEYRDSEIIIMQIEEINSEGFFRGYFHVPANDDSKSTMSGRIVEEFSEYEQAKWEFIEGFGTDIEGSWIRFKGNASIQGNEIFVYDLLYAHVGEEGFMRGVVFNDYLGFDIPADDFEWVLTDQ